MMVATNFRIVGLGQGGSSFFLFAVIVILNPNDVKIMLTIAQIGAI